MADRPSRCFYAIVTGNNHANLTAIFALAAPGDKVVWMQTPTAKQANWLQRSPDVCHQRRLQSQTIDLTGEEELSPSKFAARVAPLLGALAPDQQAVFILNGGQKFTLLGFERAAVGIQRTPIALYGDLQAAKLLKLDSFAGAFRSVPWGPNPIKLDELLQARGNVRATSCNARRVWPRTEAVPTDPLSQFRANELLRSAVLRIYSTCVIPRANEDAAGPLDEARQKLQTLVEFVRSDARATTRWKKLVATHVRDTTMRVRLEKVHPPQNNFFNDIAGFYRTQAILCLVGDRTLRVTPDEAELLRQDGWIHGDLDDGAVANLNINRSFGDAFEVAVTSRLLSFLIAEAELAKVVSEIWTNVELARDTGDGKTGAPFACFASAGSGRSVPPLR